MLAGLKADGLLLVLDTCGDRASLALFRGSALVDEAVLGERTASASLLAALRAMLARHGAKVQDLLAVGVVSGPGSFTGVRVGMAVAKGLCEAAGLEMAAVSRLEVLAEAGELSDGFALLPAGRDQVYALESTGTGVTRELLSSLAELRGEVKGRDVVVSSATAAVEIHEARSLRVVELAARHALGRVLRELADGGTDLARADANYVRNEDAIYRAASERAVAAGT